MSTTTTGEEIRQGLVEEHSDMLYLGAQAGSGGSSTTIVDTELEGRAVSAQMFDGAILRVSSGTRAGERTRIDYLDPDTGTLNLDPALSGALADTDTYEIWLRGIDPDYVDRLRDHCLATVCSVWRQNVVTVIPDGDLEASGVTNWTAAGGATRSKGYGGFPDVKARRRLSVVHTTAATDYVESDPVDCLPGERYFLEVPIQAYVTATPASPAVASIDVRDLSNTASVSLGGIRSSHTGRGWGRISLLFTIPTDCYRFSIRLKSATASSTTVWGQFACHLSDGTEFTLPDRVRSKKRVGKTFFTGDVISDTSAINRARYKLRPYWNVERNQVGSNVELMFQPGLPNNAVYYWERGYFDRLQTNYFTTAGRTTGDDATTDCPKEYIVAALAERLCKRMLDKPGGEEWQDDWARASATLNYWEGVFGPEPKMIHENEHPVVIPHFRV